MPTIHQPIPKWILIISALIALLEIIVSFTLLFSPEFLSDTVDLNARGIDYILYMWAARQFALGVIFAWATIKRSIPMLSLCYIFLVVIMIGDVLIGIYQKNNSMIISAVIMCLISIALIYRINKK
jgi:hypothetical protein